MTNIMTFPLSILTREIKLLEASCDFSRDEGWKDTGRLERQQVDYKARISELNRAIEILEKYGNNSIHNI